LDHLRSRASMGRQYGGHVDAQDSVPGFDDGVLSVVFTKVSGSPMVSGFPANHPERSSLGDLSLSSWAMVFPMLGVRYFGNLTDPGRKRRGPDGDGVPTGRVQAARIRPTRTRSCACKPGWSPKPNTRRGPCGSALAERRGQTLCAGSRRIAPEPSLEHPGLRFHRTGATWSSSLRYHATRASIIGSGGE